MANSIFRRNGTGYAELWNLRNDTSNPAANIFDDFWEASTSNVYTLTAQGGTYTLAGQSAVINRNRRLIANGGTYSFAGQQINITYTAGTNNYILTALGGSYTITGGTVGISRNRRLNVLNGNYSFTGQNATLLRSKRVVAQGGNYSFTGQQATLLRSKRIVAQGGSYSFTGATATILKNRNLSVIGGTYTYQGQTITITRTGMVWPLESDVRFGVQYGPTGVEYTGTLQDGMKYELETGRLFKPLTAKTGMLI